jgi:hypothetical protein
MLVSANLLRKPHAARDIVLLTMKLASQARENPDPSWHRRLPYLYLVKLYWGNRPAHIR